MNAKQKSETITEINSSGQKWNPLMGEDVCGPRYSQKIDPNLVILIVGNIR